MRYILTFLEGIISFISPCMLPMLPIYVTYFTGNTEQDKKWHTFFKSIAFVIGFTVVFCLFGVFAGTVGAYLSRYKTAVNIICGIIVIVLGLSYLEIIPLKFLKGMRGKIKIEGIVGAFLFGAVYSVSLTPCIGAFLGSALMLAATAGGALKGLLLLLIYSLGLGIPFIISAVLIDSLKSAFSFIKRHYRIINTISGVFLIIIGILMALGLLDRVLSLLK